MAASLSGGPITVSGSATSLTILLGLSTRLPVTDAAIRAGSGNAGRIWLGDSSSLTTTTNQMGYIDAREAWELQLSNQWVYTDEIFLIATSPGDVAFVVLVS